jgi:hypothetical protein
MPDPYGRIRRNLTSELLEGATDGALKKSRPDTSNRVADATESARGLLSHVEGGYDWSPTDPSHAAYARGYVRGS